ncbi:rhodanese-related sulfurtransferase [Thermanaerovibrio velox DSM 12556]|uniref:Rhodanese-related sulfurtransferase n=1 Tax=Thermanaerovibrio velox DSM 12556 TaxID=926567 RepID=H0UQ22_9BACT|nr:rhodanese-related sulfurtransferase [Thermanaerovibrio velox DSM 12556]
MSCLSALVIVFSGSAAFAGPSAPVSGEVVSVSRDVVSSDVVSAAGVEVSHGSEVFKGVEFLRREDVYVTPSWLMANMGRVLVLDTRAQSLYLKGHIPGAVNADWTYFVSLRGRPGDKGWGVRLPMPQMSQRLGALGVDGKRTVVVYGDLGGWGQEGWAFWVMRSYGVKNVKILEGGYTGWLKAGGRRDMVPHRGVNRGLPQLSGKDESQWNVDIDWLVKHRSEVKVIDVRTQPEYEGAKFFQERRGGRIPGALHLPFDSLFDASGALKGAEEIGALMESLGVAPSDQVVVYDTAGVRGGYACVALRMAGYYARNLDEGFHRWAGIQELEVSSGRP